MSLEASEALEKLAVRILVSTDGIKVTGSEVPGLCALTDEVLVAASGALEVAAAAAPVPRPSGKALEKCLARLVAAAMGSQVWLDDEKAGRAGKRLAKQVRKVGGDAAAAASSAQRQRELATAAAAADASLADGLPAWLAEIGTAEAAALAAPRQEVYVGFHEIAPEPPAAESPPPTAAPVAVAEAMLAPQKKWPRWLTRMMGREGCGFLDSVEKEDREADAEYLHEFGRSEDELEPLLDWSTQGSPRELFLLGVIKQLRSEQQLKEILRVGQDEKDARQLQADRESSVAAEVLSLEQLEVQLASISAANPPPIWVCACERVLDDECELCNNGIHT